MKSQMNLKKFEENFQIWVGKHKFLWLVFLSALGIFLGSLFIFLTGGSIFQAMIISIIYATIFIITDIVTWGWN